MFTEYDQHNGISIASIENKDNKGCVQVIGNTIMKNTNRDLKG